MKASKARAIAQQHLNAAEHLLAYGSSFVDSAAILVFQAATQLSHSMSGTPAANNQVMAELNGFAMNALALSRGEQTLKHARQDELVSLLKQVRQHALDLDPETLNRVAKRRQVGWLGLGLLASGYLVGLVATGGEVDPSLWILPHYQSARVVWAEQSLGTMKIGAATTGEALKISGVTYFKGIGTHAYSKISLKLASKSRLLSGRCGVDDGAGGKASVVCRIISQPGDKELFRSPLMRKGDEGAKFSVNTENISRVDLVVEDGGDGIVDDITNWIELEIE